MRSLTRNPTPVGTPKQATPGDHPRMPHVVKRSKTRNLRNPWAPCPLIRKAPPSGFRENHRPGERKPPRQAGHTNTGDMEQDGTPPTPFQALVHPWRNVSYYRFRFLRRPKILSSSGIRSCESNNIFRNFAQLSETRGNRHK